MSFQIESKDYFTIYFGQTVIDQACRGKALIQKSALKLFAKFYKKFFTHKVFGWADTLTFRSYLAFTKYSKAAYPNYRFETPESVIKLRDLLGETHYGENFCKEKGTITKSHKVVTDSSTQITADKLEILILLFLLKRMSYIMKDMAVDYGPA